jgi:hypothetical protein
VLLYLDLILNLLNHMGKKAAMQEREKRLYVLATTLVISYQALLTIYVFASQAPV